MEVDLITPFLRDRPNAEITLRTSRYLGILVYDLFETGLREMYREIMALEFTASCRYSNTHVTENYVVVLAFDKRCSRIIAPLISIKDETKSNFNTIYH